ncbi:hypothetical protein [Ureibacillus thermophilus]|uniref:Uncharacterized protein n=1 Tax=Ureibacillus thermophilus TaxID=367743 RepID=A0A4P6UNV4_9BACL|nr:hypothetical protein [Ureibacillus thermophilus]QBK24889.1 hypothetical protein DKZ56_02805 [Ureibacillus thermophilus]
MTGKSFFVYAQKFSAGLCIFPLQSSALLFCHTHVIPIFNAFANLCGFRKEKNAFIDLMILKASSSLTVFYPIKLPNRQQSTF